MKFFERFFPEHDGRRELMVSNTSSAMSRTCLLLPVAMLATNIGLAIWWSVWAAVSAKGTETALRYSTERAAREILYVPVPDEIKLKAKAYIDIAIERGWASCCPVS